MAVIATEELRPLANLMIYQARLTEQRDAVIPRLVETQTIPPGHYVLRFSKLPRVMIGPLEERVRMMDPQPFEPVPVEVQAAERGAFLTLTKRAMRQSSTAIRMKASTALTQGWARDQDTQLAAHASAFTKALGPAVGTPATANLAVVDLLKGISQLEGDPEEPIPGSGSVSCVIHTYQAFNIQNELALPGTQRIPEQMQQRQLMRRFVASLFQLGIYHTPIYPIAGADANGMMFHKSAIQRAMEREMNVEMEYIIRERATDVVLTGVWGSAVVWPNFGVRMRFNADVPQ